MKTSISLFIFILLFSCKKGQEGISDCMCVGKETSDSILTITNPIFEIKDDHGSINYNCAEVEIAIASVTDSTGNEFCKNLVDVKCISNKTYNLKLANKLSYTSAKFVKINTDNGSDKLFLMNELKENAKQVFRLNIDNKREVISITKIEQ